MDINQAGEFISRTVDSITREEEPPVNLQELGEIIDQIVGSAISEKDLNSIQKETVK